MTNRIDLSILIVCYNSLPDIDLCLTSVKNTVSTEISYEILLVDNSDDGVIGHVEAAYPYVKVIDNDKNLGFAGGNNLLANHAKGERYLLLNPDTEVLEESINDLYKISEKYPEYKTWGGYTLFPDRTREFSSKQYLPTLKNEVMRLLGLTKFIQYKTTVNEEIEYVDVLSGAYMLVDASTWKKVDGFDTSYFLYSEEVDLCMRIMENTGKKLIMTPSSSIIHYVGQSTASEQRNVFLYKGKMHLEKKMFGSLHNFAMFIVLWTFVASRFSIGCLIGVVKGNFKNSKFVSYKKVFLSPISWVSGYKA